MSENFGASTHLKACRDLPAPLHHQTRRAVPRALAERAATLECRSLTAASGEAVAQGLADAQEAKSVGMAVRSSDAIHVGSATLYRTEAVLIFSGVSDVLPTQPRAADREPGPGALPPERDRLRAVPLTGDGSGGLEVRYGSVDHFVARQAHVRCETLAENATGRDHAVANGGATMATISVVPVTTIVDDHTQTVTDGEACIQVRVREQRISTLMAADGITRDSERLQQAVGRGHDESSVRRAVEEVAVDLVTVPVVCSADGIYQQVHEGQKWDRKLQVRQVAGPKLRRQRAEERLSEVRQAVEEAGADGERFAAGGCNAQLLARAGAQVLPAHISVGFEMQPDAAAGSYVVLVDQAVQSLHAQMPHREAARAAVEFKNLVKLLPETTMSATQRSLLAAGEYAVAADGQQVDFLAAAAAEWPAVTSGESKLVVATLPVWATTAGELTPTLRTATGAQRVTSKVRATLAAQGFERMLREETRQWAPGAARPSSEAAAKKLGSTFSDLSTCDWQVTGRPADELVSAACEELDGQASATNGLAGRPAAAELLARGIVALTVTGTVRTGGSARLATLADLRRHRAWGVGSGEAAMVPVDRSPDQIFNLLKNTPHGLEALGIWSKQLAAALEDGQTHPAATMRALRLVDGALEVTDDPLTPARLVCFADPEAVANREAQALGEWPDDKDGDNPSGSPVSKKLCRALNDALRQLQQLGQRSHEAVTLLENHPHLVADADVSLRVRALLESWREQQMPVSSQLFTLEQRCPASLDVVEVQLDVVDDGDGEEVA